MGSTREEEQATKRGGAPEISGDRHNQTHHVHVCVCVKVAE